MAPKRKSNAHAAPGRSTSKRSRAGRQGRSAVSVVSTASAGQSSTPDIQTLTESITNSVTASVLANLKAAGILPDRTEDRPGPSATVTSPGPADGDATRVDNSQCNVNTSEFIFSRFPGVNVPHSATGLSHASGGTCHIPAATSSAVDSSINVSDQIDFSAHIGASKSGFVSSTLPLHFRVPQKTKDKIWSGEYVELSTLQDEEVEDLTINIKSGKILTSPTPRRTFLNIEKWTDMFCIYASVYRIKFPEQAEQLSAYMGLVRKISKEQGSWYYYDMNFRKIRLAANLRWDQIETELYLTALSRKSQPFRRSRESSAKDGSRATMPRSTPNMPEFSCNKFNKGSECVGCRYPHVCKQCGGTHPLYRCWKAHSSRFNPPNAPHQIPNSFQGHPPPLHQHHLNLPTPVRVGVLSEYLEGYNGDQKAYLLEGFCHGFHIGFSGERVPQDSPNLQTAVANPEIVDKKLRIESEAGRIAGPFDTLPLHNLKVSPLGIVPKRLQGEFRMIHHLSYPRGKCSAVNDGIEKDQTSVTYANIEDAILLLKQFGRGAYMSKTDIRSAFRILPVHPADYELLGFTWEGKFYYDRCVPMGCASSCAIFERFSTALEWVARTKLHCSGVVHILDDFLLVEANHHECAGSLRRFMSFCHEVGIPMALDKTFPPDTTMTFVGITLDSRLMEARLPQDKIDKSLSLLQSFMSRSSCKRRELESLIGYLNFTCSVVLPGRACLRRLISSIMEVKQPYHFVKISAEAKADMYMWSTFIRGFNGRSVFLNDRFLSSRTLSLYTDAAASLGFGAVYGSHWLYGPFPAEWQGFNITFLELYPIVLAVNVWGSLWRNHCVRFYTDNLALVHILNKQTSKDKQIMKLVRSLVLACLHFNVLFRSSHVPGTRMYWQTVSLGFRCRRFTVSAVMGNQRRYQLTCCPPTSSQPRPASSSSVGAVYFEYIQKGVGLFSDILRCFPSSTSGVATVRSPIEFIHCIFTS
ncbi:MAG: reverse transcriptase domain-containing protein [Sedimenticola sp.]